MFRLEKGNHLHMGFVFEALQDTKPMFNGFAILFLDGGKVALRSLNCFSHSQNLHLWPGNNIRT